MVKTGFHRALQAIILLAIVCLGNGKAFAECVVDGDTENPQGSLTLRLSQDCSGADRESRALDAQKVLEAIRSGRSIDLEGAVIQGDLDLEKLPVRSNPPPVDGVTIQLGQEVRVVAGSLSVVNSIVRGSMKHGSRRGMLVFRGPVSFAGTTFEQLVDLSRAVFTQSMKLSGATFLRESYFVQGRFLREVIAEQTVFGPHTRFHLSQFEEPVSFSRSRFGGLAEFLEVTFRMKTNFSGSSFKLGTGFSGSHFQGPADFSESLFEGDAFFTFTRFDGEADFRRARFRATADFDDAQFNAGEQFSGVTYEKEPQFARSKRPTPSTQIVGGGNPQVQYAITLGLLLLSAMLIAYLVKSR
ncbi:pentapeptide repeat-containing protein [Petrachloros mirabilis]